MVRRKDIEAVSSSGEISTFLKKVGEIRSAESNGRLVFIIDATASRQPTWDTACSIQASMFRAVDAIGRLQVQLVYFGGFAGFHVCPWVSDSRALLLQMSRVRCEAGHTRIHQSLGHLLAETRSRPVTAAVYIGDACEEPGDGILRLAGQLALQRTPLFMFQEGQDSRAAGIFESVARLSGGAWCRFDHNSAAMLEELLSAVAVYATGGEAAFASLLRNGSPQLQILARQLLR